MAEYKGRIYKEIEQSADYHPSALYDLLTFHNSMFEREGDSLGYDYIPLTGSKLAPKTQVLPFIVGLIPPSANVTGKLLDRSASLAAIPGQIEAPTGSPASGLPSQSTGKGTTPWKGQKGSEKTVKYQTTGMRASDVRELIIAGWTKIYGTPPSEDAIRTLIAQHFVETGGGYGFNFNMAGIKGIGPSGLTVETRTNEVWDGKGKRPPEVPENATPPYTYQITANFKAYTSGEEGVLDWLTLLTNRYPKALEAANNGDTAGYAHELRAKGYYTALESEYARGIKLWVDRMEKQGLENIGGSGKPLPPGFPLWGPDGPPSPDTGGPVAGDASGKPDWQKGGSADAQTSAEAEEAKAYKELAKTDLNKGQLGQKLQGAQKNVIRALQIAIQQMASTPPLRMVLNPESFKVSSQKVISDGNWGRNGAGIGIEHWGDGQDTISASGRVAGFYALDQGNVGTNALGRSPGLTRMARAFSFSYQNFLSLYLIYRNNGGVWLEDFADAKNAKTTKPNNLALVGSVYIYYDNTIYIGSFDSFEMSEEDTAPFTLSYSFNFTVRASYLLDRQGNDNPNPNTTYGLPAIFGAVAPTAPTNTTSVKPSPVAGQVVQPPPGGAVIDQANKPAPVATQPTGGPSGLYTEDLSNAFSPGGLTLSPPQPIKTTADIIPLGGYGGWTPQLPKK